MTTSKPVENEPDSPKLLLNARAAAAALSISERKLWELTHCGTIKATRIGRAVRYSVSALEEFVTQQTA